MRSHQSFGPHHRKERRDWQATPGCQEVKPGRVTGPGSHPSGRTSQAHWCHTLGFSLLIYHPMENLSDFLKKKCFYLKCTLLKKKSRLWRWAGWTYWNFWTAGHHCWTLWRSWQECRMLLTGTVLVSPSACCGFLGLELQLPKQPLSSEFGKKGGKSPLPHHHQCPKHHWCSGQTHGNWRPSYSSGELRWLLTAL